MRVIFTTFALDAHFLGQVPLAWALRAAGHEVRVVSQPALTGTVTTAGLTAVPVGGDHTVLAAIAASADGAGADWDPAYDLDPVRPEVHHPTFLRISNAQLTRRFFMRANNDSMIDGLVRFARSWRPDLVIWEPFTVAGAVAAEVVGAAHARLLWGVDLALDQREWFLRECGDRAGSGETDALAAWLGGVLDRYGLGFDERVVRGHWTIDPMPASVRLPLGGPTLPVRYIPYNGAAVVPDWLRDPAPRPRVCLTAGITARSGSGRVSLSGVLDAVADLDVDVVATLDATQRDQVAVVPDNVRVVDFVPLHALLPTCSVVAHHGGAGTWSTAAVSGVPQLLFPSEWDDFYRARRTAELGAALVLPAMDLSPAALRAGLQRLLDEPSFADGAERLQEEMLSEPTPGEVVGALERLTLEHQDLRT